MVREKIRYRYDRDLALNLLTDESRYEDWDSAEREVKETKSFISSAFDDFEGLNRLDTVKFAFCVPTRVNRHTENYWEEIYEFLPGMKYLDRNTRFRILASLPPLKIASYGKQGGLSNGIVIFVPIFSDMVKDYRNKFLLKRDIDKRINDAANLAHDKFGVKYLGLGAILPKLTKFGQTIKTDLITTTGHAGTVWLMEQIFDEVCNRYHGRSRGLKVGFIGAGSIGVSALEKIAINNPDNYYHIYDIRPKNNRAVKEKMAKYGIKLKISKSNQHLSKECDIVLSAVTSKVEITGIDMTNKVIIDDSQPGQFVREEVQREGGTLIWVVGKDVSENHFATRKNGYSYGPNGLYGSNSLWGCEAEVASIAKYDKPELAIRDHVTTDQVDAIGDLFDKMGIVIADFQSHGQLNDK